MAPTTNAKTVVVLGASPKPDRFAFKAMQKLREHGYRAIPVNPAFPEILGKRCYGSIREIKESIDTVTLYLGTARSTPLIKEIIAARPRRIIFNPGAENSELASEAGKDGIEVVNDCTLVMLESGSF